MTTAVPEGGGEPAVPGIGGDATDDAGVEGSAKGDTGFPEETAGVACETPGIGVDMGTAAGRVAGAVAGGKANGLAGAVDDAMEGVVAGGGKVGRGVRLNGDGTSELTAGRLEPAPSRANLKMP